MHIPDTLSIVQEGNCSLNCIRYVDFLERKQETVNILAELALQHPDLYQENCITRACYDVAYAQQYDYGGLIPPSVQVKALNVPNIPTNKWKILGSDGHGCHLIHPEWGIWTLANNEVLYLQATKNFSEQTFQFYVQNGTLKLGIASEVQEKAERIKHVAFVNTKELTDDDLGRVVLYGKNKHLVLSQGETLHTYTLPNFKYTSISNGVPVIDNGPQLHQYMVERTELRYPTLAAFGATQTAGEGFEWKAQRMNDILQYQLSELLSEAFQIRKKISFSWECLGIEGTPNRPLNYLARERVSINLPETLAHMLKFDNTTTVSPTSLQLIIHKKAKTAYELTISSTVFNYNCTLTFEELIEMLNQKVQMHNIAFAAGTTYVYLHAD